MGIIAWIIFGALVGWIASIIMRTNESQGALANIIVGILGAMIGGFLASIFGLGDIDGFNIGSFLIALGGAILLLAIVNMFRSHSVRD
jgi:uncharacterized membrane protein YeaQ/YmgE (transglycosylase-associated protein family)